MRHTFKYKICYLFLLCCAMFFGQQANAQLKRVKISDRDTTYFDVQPDSAEYEILRQVYDATGGPGWHKNTYWLKGTTSQDMSKWYGVEVQNGDVTGINLNNNGLSHEIPEVVYRLARLRHVSSAGNNLQNKNARQQPVSQMSAGVNTVTTLAAPLTQAVTSGKNLPVWGLAVSQARQSVDWRIYPPTVETLPNSDAAQGISSTGVAIDYCGRLAFYVLHSGNTRTLDFPNRLHLYAPDGVRLTNETAGSPLLALNSAAGNIELQVIPVPYKTDEWYIIYSLFKRECLSLDHSSTYCPVVAVYAKVRYDADTHVLAILQREVPIKPGVTFSQGKAVTKDIDGDPNRHYLYLAQRDQASAYVGSMILHRFIIDESGIYPESQALVSPSIKYWQAGVSGSGVEVSPDGKRLAISNPSTGPAGEFPDNFVLYDLTRWKSTEPDVVKILSIPRLKIDNTNMTVEQMVASYPCLKWLANKVSVIEFSPSGRFLYAVGGGDLNTGGVSFDTYLFQIDLESSTGTDLTVRLRTQQGKDVGANCQGSSPDPTNTPLEDMQHPVTQIQSGYDGRLYFTKHYSNKVFVVPNPDDVLGHSLVATELDMSTPHVPNIQMLNSKQVIFMPENMDGYEYMKESEDERFILDHSSIGVASVVKLTPVNFQSNNVYQVAWGDGSIQTITSGSATHSYAATGMYKITLTVTRPNKCAYKISKPLEVVPCTAVTDIGIDNSTYICAVKFGSRKLVNCLASYQWNFGDGTTSQERNPLHAYATPGTYTVTLQVQYDCAGCQGIKTISKQVTFAEPANYLGEELVNIETDERYQVISTAASSFTDGWTLGQEDDEADSHEAFANGSQGVWRNDATFVYEKDRKLSTPVNIATDGTYTLEQFNWAYADLNGVPNWIRSNSITAYSPYSYELENKDVLNNYTAAIYDYGGHLAAATGTNMRCTEMGFTGFEHVEDNTAGNWVVNTDALPAYRNYHIISGNKNMAVVDAPVQALEGVTGADVSASRQFAFGLRMARTYIKGNQIVCVRTYPGNPLRSIAVLQKSPFEGLWSGEMRIKTNAAPSVTTTPVETLAHTGRYSMAVSTDKTIRQDIIRLVPGKSYFVNVWVSADTPNLMTPQLPGGLGIDIVARQKNGQRVQTFPFLPDGPVVEGWQQVKGTFQCPAGTEYFEIKFKRGTGPAAYYDDLRIHPREGNLKGFVYDVQNYRLMAVLDEENFATFFYYDQEGNLFLTKKETARGVMTVSENMSYINEREE